jgi:hypothetical protein
MLGGGVTVLVAILLLSVMTRATTLPDLAWRMALLGLGLGPLQSLFGIAVQNAVRRDQIGVATSANQFFRQIGSTVGIAVFGTFLTNGMNARLADWARAMGRPPLDMTQLRGLAVQAQTGTGAGAGTLNLPDPIRDIIVGSITHVVLLSAAIVALALAATLMIPELPMASRMPATPPGEPTPDAHL